MKMRYRIAGPWLAAITALAVIGCGGSTSTSAPSAGAEAPTSAATSAPTTETTTAATDAATPAPTEAAPSEAAPSVAIPNFVFPSTDKELEALLPDTMCGGKTQKFSMGGDTFESSADPAFIALLEKLGKTSADVSFAVAAPVDSSSACSAGILRIKGADSGALKDAFLAQAVTEGTTYTMDSIDGRDVYVDASADPPTYSYFKGDGIVFAGADNAKDAASILSALP
jgi:hypothetical protein